MVNAEKYYANALFIGLKWSNFYFSAFHLPNIWNGWLQIWLIRTGYLFAKSKGGNASTFTISTSPISCLTSTNHISATKALWDGSEKFDYSSRHIHKREGRWWWGSFYALGPMSPFVSDRDNYWKTIS